MYRTISQPFNHVRKAWINVTGNEIVIKCWYFSQCVVTFLVATEKRENLSLYIPKHLSYIWVQFKFDIIRHQFESFFKTGKLNIQKFAPSSARSEPDSAVDSASTSASPRDTSLILTAPDLRMTWKEGKLGRRRAIRKRGEEGKALRRGEAGSGE